jgi:DNA-binding CsgD family transcriptional regulator
MEGVIKLAAEKSGWGKKKGVSQGFSVYFSHASYVAQVCEVIMQAGKPVVKKIYAIADCGEVVNLGGARQQVMGGVVDGMGHAMYGKLSFKNGAAEQNNFKFITYLCLVGEIRILSRIANSQDRIFSKLNKLRNEVLVDPQLKAMAWLVDLAEIFVKNNSNDLVRINNIVKRNPENSYIQKFGQSNLKKVDLDGDLAPKDPSEMTAFEVIKKNLYLSKSKNESKKKQLEYLRVALAKGEQVGAREFFLRQDNSTLEEIVNLSHESNSLWLESLGRSSIERIKERNRLVEISGEQLTEREIEVLKYLVSENTIVEIGQTLHISKNTMKTHLRNIYKKLGVDGRGAAAKKAQENLII